MKVIYGIGRVKKAKNTIVAMGIFDGVHVGHQFLLNKVLGRSRKIKGFSVAVTFYPHPSHVLKPKRELQLLISLKERLRLLGQSGLDLCIVINFSPRFSQIKPEDFIRDYIVSKLNPREVFIGKDFVFGKHKQGNIKLLQRLGREKGFMVRMVKPLRISGEVVSSTLIRNLIKNNQLLQVSKLLNRSLSIRGKVIKGTGWGDKLGFPTANLRNYEGILPSRGVYAARVIYNKRRFTGMAYIGRRPSFVSPDKNQAVEVHIFNFKNSIYGENIEIEFLKKIREEKRFPNSASLINQLRKDYLAASRVARSLG